MHRLQKILLERLLLRNNQNYATLTAGYDFDDNIVFHLKQLQNNGYLKKHKGVYSITMFGVKTIRQFEPAALEDKGVKTFFLGFLCHDQEGNYLIKSHPHARENFYNLPSGKPFFGETIESALTRTFKLNTGLNLTEEQFKFTSLHLRTIQTAKQEIMFDDAFAIYKIAISSTQKRQMQLHQSLSWMNQEQIKKLGNKWPEIDMCISVPKISPYEVYLLSSNYIL